MNTAQTINSSPAKAAGFEIDMDNLDAPAEAVTFDVVVIEDEEGEPVAGFKIVGKNSPQYQAASAEIRQDNIRRASKRNKQIDTSTEEGAKLIALVVAGNERKQNMAVVVDWFGFNCEGAPMTYDSNLAKRLLTKHPHWLTMIGVALDKDANFMKV